VSQLAILLLQTSVQNTTRKTGVLVNKTEVTTSKRRRKLMRKPLRGVGCNHCLPNLKHVCLLFCFVSHLDGPSLLNLLNARVSGRGGASLSAFHDNTDFSAIRSWFVTKRTSIQSMIELSSLSVFHIIRWRSNHKKQIFRHRTNSAWQAGSAKMAEMSVHVRS